MAVGCVGNAQQIDWLDRLAGNVGRCDNAFPGAGMSQQRVAQRNISDRINSRLGGAHVFVNLHKATLRLDLGLLEADILGHGRAAHCNQHLLGFQLLRLAIDGKR